MRIVVLLLSLDVVYSQNIKVGHIEYTTADLASGQMEAKAAFLLAEKRLRSENLIPNSITFSFAWEPADNPDFCAGGAAILHHIRNNSDWIIGPQDSTGSFH